VNNEFPSPLAEDREFLKQARLAGAIVDLDPNLAEELKDEDRKHSGYAVLMCGDCDHAHDSIEHLKLWLDTARIHLIAVNGGGILLDPNAPPNRGTMNFAPFVREQIRQAFEMKKFNHLLIDTHDTCGAAQRSGMFLRQSVQAVLNGKQYLVKDPQRAPRLRKILPILRSRDEAGKIWVEAFRRRSMEPFLRTYRPLVADSAVPV
jgi:hypothetical protein